MSSKDGNKYNNEIEMSDDKVILPVRKRSSSPSIVEPPLSKIKVESSSEHQAAHSTDTEFSSSQSSKVNLEAMELEEQMRGQREWTSAFSKRARNPSSSALGFNPSLSSRIKMKQRLVGDTVEKNRFQFMRPLDSHGSCVNALAFSPGQGRYLASAGDDMRIHIRDVLSDIDSGDAKPLIHLIGHRSNIFSLAWSCDGKRLFSGGNDDKVLHYDVSQSSLPSAPPPFIKNEPLSVAEFLGKSRRDNRRSNLTNDPEELFATPKRKSILETSIAPHEDSIKEVSTHPKNPNLVLSCSDSGEICLTDVRVSNSIMNQKREAKAPWSSCLFNPNQSDGNTFAASTTSSINGSTCLYDLRSFFSNSDETINQSDAVIEYASVLQNYQPNKKGLLSTKAEVLSLAWSPDGKMLSTNVSLFKPTLYAVGDPLPLAVLSTTSLTPHLGTSANDEIMPESGGYHSGCTIKHGSFARWDDDLFYATGSDDFRGYGWKIPEIETLKEMREIEEWRKMLISQTDGGQDDIYYVHHGGGSSTDRMQHFVSVLPTSISKPHFTLEGAKSITNTVQCHPNLPFIATAGVERLVRLYSCLPIGDERLNRKENLTTRKRNRIRNKAAVARAMLESFEDDSNDSDEGHDDGVAMADEDQDDEEIEEWETDEESQKDQEEEKDILIASNSDLKLQESRSDLTHYQHHLLSLIKNGHKNDENVLALFDELIREEEGRRLFDRTSGLDSDSDDSEEEEVEDDEDENEEYIGGRREGGN